MKHISTVKNVSLINLSDRGVICSIKKNPEKKIISDGDGIYLINDKNIQEIVNEKITVFKPFNKGILYNTMPEMETQLKFYDFNKIITLTEDPYYFDPLSNRYSGGILLSNFDKEGKEHYYFMDYEFNIKELPDFYQIKIKDKYIQYSKKGSIKAFQDKTFSIVWQTDIRQFGKYIFRDRKTGEILAERDNEIQHAPLAYNNLLIVPLIGGQLVALDIETGEKVWMYEGERIFGRYELYENRIYRNSGNSIQEISVDNGKLIKDKKFKDDPLISNYNATGEFLVNRNVIVLKDSPAKIVVLNRETFEVMDYIKMDARLGSLKNNLVWHNNHLYVLDISNNLYIFEKEENNIQT